MTNMATCLVPDFPAVMIALEHLKELDKQLKEDGIPFSPEASLHLTEITSAITQLEADRRAAHEHLEVETIENSNLRHQSNIIRERMSQEIMADVAAARASNAEEIEQLQKELLAVSQLQESVVERQEAVLSQNEALYPEREQVKAEHDKVVAALNDQINLKYGLQLHLDQTQEQVEQLKSSIAAVEQDKITLPQNMALEREAFTAKQDNQSREVDQVEGKIKQQRQDIRRSRRELDTVDNKKRETSEHLDELTLHVAKLESEIQRLTASLCECEKQLEGETQKHQDLRRQRQTLKKELFELRETLAVAVQHLKEQIATVEGKIEESQASRLLFQDSLAHIFEVFKHQCDEENEVKAEYHDVSQQLEQSKLQLEERIASIVRLSKETKDMNKQIAELLEATTINTRMFERNQEEMYGDVDTEKKNVSHFEEEKGRLTRLLEKAKRKQEEHVAKMNSDIGSTRRRYQELRQEEDSLLQRQPKSSDAGLLMRYVAECEVEYGREETKRHQEIEQCAAATESIVRSNEERQREVEEKEEMLKEVEATWDAEVCRHHRLEMLTHELMRQRSDLEVSIQELKEKTSSLLQPKENMKTALGELRGIHMGLLKKQASELRAVEISTYNNSVNLQEVSMENSRLHLHIRQMTEDVSRAREDKDRYWQELQQFRQDILALFESLQEAWREDVLLTQDCQSSDGALLESMSAMTNFLKTRREELGNFSTLLHHQMLDFSKRLGDKTTVD